MDTRSLVERSSKRAQLFQVPSPPACLDPFDKLSTEVIQNIFVSACPHVDFPELQSHRRKKYSPYDPEGTNPTILSLVCTRWRDIATTYHPLWTNFILHAPAMSRRWTQWSSVQLGRRLLRSGARPLKIRIDNYMSVGNSTACGTLDLLTMHIKRLHTLVLYWRVPFTDELIRKLNSLDGRLPLLKYFYILTGGTELEDNYDDDNLVKCTAFLSAQSLSCFGLGGSAYGHRIQIPWTQFSEVTFDNTLDPFTHDFHKIMECLSTSSITVLTFSSEPWTSKTIPPSSEKPIKLTKL